MCGNKDILWISAIRFAAVSRTNWVRNLFLIVLVLFGMPTQAVDCGAEGQRPCLLMERIPSCDPPLVENPEGVRCTLPPYCTPDCTDKTCGAPDGCGSTCMTGSCPSDQYCSANGALGQCGARSFGQAVECFVFDDGYTNMAGPSHALYVLGAGRVCMPSSSGNGTCRKWFGRCRTTDASHEPVYFQVYDGYDLGRSNVAQLSDAIFVNNSSEMCIPDSGSGTCRIFAGRARLQSGLPVQAKLFNDGETDLTDTTDGFAVIGAPYNFNEGPQSHKVCAKEGSTLDFFGIDGTCRKWFGLFQVAGCGDGVCGTGETPANCKSDCHCGDQVCSAGENVSNCPGDCPVRCGDGICSTGENVSTCSNDCPVRCGDGICSTGETSDTCVSDCPLPNTCSGAVAGPGATHYAIGVKDGNGCAMDIVTAFANSQSEAQECVQNAYPFGITVTDPNPMSATYHTDPTYGCAELQVTAFSSADAASCAKAAGYTYEGSCP